MRAASFTATIVGLVGALAGGASAQSVSPDEYRELARTILEELVEINTTNSDRGRKQHRQQTFLGSPICQQRPEVKY